MRIGIPTTLIYFSYFPLWKTFFEELGFEVIASPTTSKEIMDCGVAEAVNDACVPVKLFHGHVLALKDKVDYLFIPRMVSVTREATFCPKFLGLPDMIKHSIEGLPGIIDTRIDLKRGKFELFRVCREIGGKLGKGLWLVVGAYFKAVKAQKKYQQLLLGKLRPQEALDYLSGVEQNSMEMPLTAKARLVNLAVVGYPYEVYDSYVSVNMLKYLEKMGVKVWTAEMVSARELRRQAKKLPKTLFWHYSNLVIRAAFYYIEQPHIDGIIHLSAFGCGPDAMVDKLIELEAREKGSTPFMTITIDEHSGEAGMQTRLEAFVDMVRMRREAR
jgi:predicted nucleotide-binding protein (sugar kinase/HSP70/actin superfamily)